ncbi:MAG: hypothetical protein H5U22_03820 [Rhizobium sp.]|nr:hypothetical protein [Rhizobium sp.]
MDGSGYRPAVPAATRGNVDTWALPSEFVLPSGIDGYIDVSRYRRPYPFFREFESGKIGVMSILHERMDIPARLVEELG